MRVCACVHPVRVCAPCVAHVCESRACACIRVRGAAELLRGKLQSVRSWTLSKRALGDHPLKSEGAATSLKTTSTCERVRRTTLVLSHLWDVAKENGKYTNMSSKIYTCQKIRCKIYEKTNKQQTTTTKTHLRGFLARRHALYERLRKFCRQRITLVEENLDLNRNEGHWTQ